MPGVSTALLLSFMISPSVANTPLDLRWKFAEGEVLYVTVTKTNESTYVEKGEVVQKWFNSEIISLKMTVIAASEKEEEIKLTHLSVFTGVAETGEKLKTTRKKSAIDGQSFTFILKPEGKVTKIRGNNALWNAAPSYAPELAAGMLATNLFRTVPGKAMRVGERWDVESGYPTGGGIMEVTARSYADSVADGVVKVVAGVDHSWDCRGAKTDGTFDELHGKDGVREAWFDLKAGRVRKVEQNRAASGPVRPPWQNWVVTHREKLTIEVSDTPPKEE